MGLERFTVKQNLSNAGDAEVYLAEDADGRAVELWMLDQLLADANRAESVRRRVRLANLLQHVGAAPILEASLDEAPFYLARPPRPRSTLEQRFGSEVPLKGSDAARLFRQLLDTLAAAHRLGLVHGRLTPTSIGWDESRGLQLDFLRFDDVDGPPQEDLAAAGAVLAWLTAASDPKDAGPTVPSLSLSPAEHAAWQTLRRLAAALRLPDPDDRPSATEAIRWLDEAFPTLPPSADLQATQINLDRDTPPADEMPRQLGRFRIVEKLGQGGMGTVYRAIDAADGATVAIKVLNPDLAKNPKALKRFEKEARMLASVRSAYVANLLDVNEERGVHFLALEFVRGKSLKALLDERRRLDEPLALNLAADICRALTEAHARGVVHRDIKPENVLLAEDPETNAFRVKLTDFGLARQIQQSQSLDMTRESVVGTPLYMAPEQGAGAGTIDARADIYSLGATLFHLLAGEPPFRGETPMEVLYKHANEPPPRLQSLNATVSDSAGRLIERALAKAPAERFADAAAMLAEIERLLRGEPSSLAIHPLLPPTDPRSVKTYEFRWECSSSPEQLWPYVSNTERLNRAIGLPAVDFTTRRDGGRLRRFGSYRKLGMKPLWEEHPFEWIEGRRMGVLRVVERGPFEWLSSVVELAPRPGGGTILTHRFQLVPRGVLGRLIAAVEIGVKARRNLERVYRESDEVIQRRKPGVIDDPFEPGRALSGRRRVLLRQGISRLIDRGVAPVVAERMEEYLAAAPEQAVTRIRPLAVAEQLALDPSQFVNACLHGAREGLLVMLWDILCPTCRIPSQVQDSLRAIREHGRCEACNLDFELDFANSVELIFRAHPDIRPGELGTYCIGGPAHSPHVAAQVRVAAGERMELNLDLGDGAYRLRGPQLSYAHDFRVKPGTGRSRWELLLSRRPGPEAPRQFAPGGQTIALVNDTPQELLVRVERTAPRTDALTAARAASLPLFRELFPAETLAPGQLVSIAQLTLLVTELDGVEQLYRDLGDAEAFARLHEHFRLLDVAVRGEGGAVVKTVHGGLIASFAEPLGAVRAALRMPGLLADSTVTRDLRLRCGVHRGPAYTATINDRLDYFGSTVTAALQLPRFAKPGGVALSRAVAATESVSEYLQASKIEPELINLDNSAVGEPFAYHIGSNRKASVGA